jgi:hypothetical protein
MNQEGSLTITDYVPYHMMTGYQALGVRPALICQKHFGIGSNDSMYHNVFSTFDWLE